MSADKIDPFGKGGLVGLVSGNGHRVSSLILLLLLHQHAFGLSVSLGSFRHTWCPPKCSTFPASCKPNLPSNLLSELLLRAVFAEFDVTPQAALKSVNDL